MLSNRLCHLDFYKPSFEFSGKDLGHTWWSWRNGSKDYSWDITRNKEVKVLPLAIIMIVIICVKKLKKKYIIISWLSIGKTDKVKYDTREKSWIITF